MFWAPNFINVRETVWHLAYSEPLDPRTSDNMYYKHFLAFHGLWFSGLQQSPLRDPGYLCRTMMVHLRSSSVWEVLFPTCVHWHHQRCVLEWLCCIYSVSLCFFVEVKGSLNYCLRCVVETIRSTNHELVELWIGRWGVFISETPLMVQSPTSSIKLVPPGLIIG